MGKFYELFEMDAHIGAKELDLQYMKVGTCLSAVIILLFPDLLLSPVCISLLGLISHLSLCLVV